MTNTFLTFGFIAATSSFLFVSVHAANSYSWQPSVSLTANLDEPQALGFCLDIVGFGNGMDCQRLQAHSCKSAGADTQFEYHAPTQSVRAVNYNSDCESIAEDNGGIPACIVAKAIEAGARMGLAACDRSDEQRFGLNGDGNSYELVMADSLCIVVDDTTRQANSWVARNLFLADCASTPDELKRWTITPTPEDTLEDSSPSATIMAEPTQAPIKSIPTDTSITTPKTTPVSTVTTPPSDARISSSSSPVASEGNTSLSVVKYSSRLLYGSLFSIIYIHMA